MFVVSTFYESEEISEQPWRYFYFSGRMRNIYGKHSEFAAENQFRCAGHSRSGNSLPVKPAR